MLNYGGIMSNAPSPISRGVGAANKMQGLMQNRNVLQQQAQDMQAQQQQAAAQQQAAQQKQMALQQGAELLMGDDYAAQADFMFKNPDVAKDFIGAMNFKDGAQIADRIEFNKSVISSATDPVAALQGRIEEVRAKGGNTENLEDTLALGDPEEIRNTLRKELNFLDAQSMMDYNKLEGGNQEPMTEYQSAMIEKYKIDQDLRRLEIAKANAKNDLQKDKLQLEIDDKATKLEEAKKNIKSKGIDLDFEFQVLKDEADDMLNLIDSIRTHQGLDSAVGLKGASSLGGILNQPMAGSPAADAVALIDNLEAKNYIAGVQKFKEKGGGGSLSDSEGKQLAAELANLSRKQSSKAFRRTLDNVESLVKRSISRQEDKAAKKKGSNVDQSNINVTEMSDEELFN